MSQREWVFKIDGIQHRLQLRHTWIGWREIWLDGERVHRSYLFNDGGSFHEFWLQSHLIEVNIYTNGIAFSFHLLVDGVLQPERKEAERGQPAQPLPRRINDRVWWQEYIQESGMTYLPGAGMPWHLRHRAVGWIEGRLAGIFSFPKAQSATLGHLPIKAIQALVFVKHQPPVDEAHVLRQLETDPDIRALLGKRSSTNAGLEITPTYTNIILPLDTRRSPKETLERLRQFVCAVTRYTSPLPEGRCENPQCASHGLLLPQLSLVNGMPFMIYSACRENLKAQAQADRKKFQNAPHNLGRGILAGIAVALVCSLVWAVVAYFQDAVAVLVSWGIFSAIMKVMDKVGTKPGTRSVLATSLLTMLSVVFGVYLRALFTVLQQSEFHFEAEMLPWAWQALWENSELLLVSLVFAGFYQLSAILNYFRNLRLQTKLMFDPEVEVVPNTAPVPAGGNSR